VYDCSPPGPLGRVGLGHSSHPRLQVSAAQDRVGIISRPRCLYQSDLYSGRVYSGLWATTVPSEARRVHV
jgi:hypothetical protein